MLHQLRQVLVAFLLLSLFSPAETMGFARSVSLEMKMWRRRRKTRGASPQGGAYRDSLGAAQSKISELEFQLAAALAANDQRDEIIGLLFKGRLRDFFLRPLRRLWGLVPKPSASQRGLALALLSSTAILYGVCAAIPQHANTTAPRPRPHRSYTYIGPPFVIRVQITTGGEVTQGELQAELWEWSCAFTDRWECHLVPGSPYRLAPWQEPFPSCHINAWMEGDRSWLLWVYPERQGPETLVYILD